MLHANDLLDSRVIENGSFTSAYLPGSIQAAIKEITNLVMLTLEDRKIKLDVLLFEWRNLNFDKRRL